MRSVGVLHAIWSPPLAAEAPAAVKETILECGQTTSVSMPSALFGDAAAGAGLLRNRAGTVNERRPLCSGGGACSGVLEGACGEDMVFAHACISGFAVSCYVSLAEYKQRRGRRRTCRPVVLSCMVEHRFCRLRRRPRALLIEHLARGMSFTGSTALQMSITEFTGSTRAIVEQLAPCSNTDHTVDNRQRAERFYVNS